MARKGSKKSSSVKVDFSGVETLAKMDEGETLLKVVEATQEEGDKAPYIKWVLENEDGARVWVNTSLSKQSLWNLKAFLEALGEEVPDDELDIDLEEMVDKELMGMIEHETFEGKKRPRLVDFWPADGESSKEDSSDEPDFDEMDEDDLAKFIKKNKLDVDIDDLSVKKARKAVAEAYEEANEDKGKKGKRGKGKEKPTEDEVNEMDEDDLEKTISHFELDVDLSKYKTLRKMRAAVVEALE